MLLHSTQNIMDNSTWLKIENFLMILIAPLIALWLFFGGVSEYIRMSEQQIWYSRGQVLHYTLWDYVGSAGLAIAGLVIALFIIHYGKEYAKEKSREGRLSKVELSSAFLAGSVTTFVVGSYFHWYWFATLFFSIVPVLSIIVLFAYDKKTNKNF